jgi:hypothetical protein
LELEKENLDRHAILFIESQIGFGLAFKLRGERGSSAIKFDTLFCEREVSQIATATERPKFRIS